MARTTKKANTKKSKPVESDFFAEITEGVTLDLYDKGKKGISAKLTLADCFVIYAKVVEGKNGAFLSYPNFKTKDGDYINQAYCFDKEINEIINEALETYIEG